MSIEAGMWVWRLGGGTKKKEGKEKISLCESIGHRPLWGRIPKTGKMSVYGICVSLGWEARGVDGGWVARAHLSATIL